MNQSGGANVFFRQKHAWAKRHPKFLFVMFQRRYQSGNHRLIIVYLPARLLSKGFKSFFHMQTVSFYVLNRNMKILHLTLHRHWFAAIASGDKTVEYRERKPYWEKRLVEKSFDKIHFRNGFSRNAPFMRVECLEITDTVWDDSPAFGIQLGRILEIQNWPVT